MWPLRKALGLMLQMTGAKVMLAVGGRCCQRCALGTLKFRQGRPESMDLFVLMLCFCLGQLIQRWCDQEVLCGTSAANHWQHADTRIIHSWEPEPPGS